MLKSYLPSSFNTLFALLSILFWFFDYQYLLLATLMIYFFIYVSLRRNRNDFRDDQAPTKGVIYSPANGKVIHIEHNVSHGIFGEQLIELQIMIPWWKEMGLFMPLSSEVKNLVVQRGYSFFRYSKAVDVLGAKVGKGVNLLLDNRGENIGLSFYKCKLGLWPELIVMPGDKGGRRVNIGYFPFGGTVLLYLPKKYEILIKDQDDLSAGETILAVVPDLA